MDKFIEQGICCKNIKIDDEVLYSQTKKGIEFSGTGIVASKIDNSVYIEVPAGTKFSWTNINSSIPNIKRDKYYTIVGKHCIKKIVKKGQFHPPEERKEGV